MNSKTKIKGQLSKRETEKLIRNEKKLIHAQTECKVAADCIVKESDWINLDRFKWTNPMISEFVSSLLSNCYLMTEKYHKLDNFENIFK